MLKPFKLVHHKIRKVQSFVNYIFLNIICRAPQLQAQHPEFTSDMAGNYSAFLENTSGYLLGPLEIIYSEAKKLSFQHIKTLRRAVHINIKIRELCTGMHQPVSYEDLNAISPVLSNAIKLFCCNLYDKVTPLKEFTNNYQTLRSYYNTLVDCTNTCYCCGIYPIANKYEPARSPFDHFLPQAKYPFVSLNVHNLVPTCECCNGRKHQKDTFFIQNNRNRERIKAFYPFRYEEPGINIKLNIPDGCNITTVQPQDIDLQIDCENYPEETKNWKRLYDIELRYKAEYTSKDIIKYYEQYQSCKELGLSYEQIIKACGLNTFGDKNIVKRPLMEYFNKKEEEARNKGFIK